MIQLERVWKTYHHHVRMGVKERLLGQRIHVEDQRFDRSWALQDISVHITPGRSLGIVGCNGTGKSTLLGLILGTIKEDRGTITRRGLMGALLELGAGTHPELTGRENIFLYGAILGLSIAYVRKKFDDIVDFSELGSAIDSPMRTYSSGMSARLTFSVLVHAQRDVLLIDEILAVGDAKFQAKCATFLRQYTAAGGTLVVVSHNLQELQELCVQGLWLHEGQVAYQGTIDATISRYTHSELLETAVI